jgi:cytochrome P450
MHAYLTVTPVNEVMMSIAPTSTVDIFSDEVLLDPYAALNELREQAGAVWVPANNVWAISRYADVRAAFLNHATFSSNKVAFNDMMNEALQGTTLATDPPDHHNLRAALMENLTPRALRKMKDDIDATADRIVSACAAQGSFDGVKDIAEAVVLEVVADLIGVQGVARENILRWGVAAFNVLGPMNQRTGENFPIAGELFGWATNVQAEDLAEGSMGRGIFAAAERGDIPVESCGHIIHQYVAAGMDTTIASIGNTLWLLGANPDQYELLRSDHSLVQNAFNEALRMEPPVHAFGRVTKKEATVDGVAIPAGAQVALLFMPGNRDPRHYLDPDTFSISRNSADNLAFGYGPHSCAGQGLARMQGQATLESFARHIKSFTIGEPARRISNSTRGLGSLPISSVALA